MNYTKCMISFFVETLLVKGSVYFIHPSTSMEYNFKNLLVCYYSGKIAFLKMFHIT